MLLQLAPWFGYLASLFLALSLLVNNDLKFRWLNTGGTIAFIIYGAMISAIPILITNGILFVINVFYLYKIYTRKELFEILEFQSGAIIVDRFLSFYQQDIEKYFPEFNRAELEGNLNFVVLRDLVIANVFSASVNNSGEAEVKLNFTVDKYRDYKVGRFIFEKERQFLISKGVKRVVYPNVSHKGHEKFLKVSGFSKEQDQKDPRTVLSLT